MIESGKFLARPGLLLAALAAALLIGPGLGWASGNVSVQESESAEYTVEGAHSFEGIELKYIARQIATRTVQGRLDIGDKPFSFSLDLQQGLAQLDGGGATLVKKERDALAQLTERIAARLEASPSFPAYALHQFAAYWSEAPDGYRHVARNVDGPSDIELVSLANDGVTCVRRGRSYRAEWTTSNGSARSRNTTVNSTFSGRRCMGRCGAECGVFFLPSSYTLDCLDHDVCSAYHSASGGGSDPNCGDEFGEAADDYIFGVPRGCRGR